MHLPLKLGAFVCCCPPPPTLTLRLFPCISVVCVLVCDSFLMMSTVLAWSGHVHGHWVVTGWSLVQVGGWGQGGNGPHFSPGMLLSPFSFACILLGVGGRVRSSLCSQMATVIVDYALQLYLSCFREKNNKCHRNLSWLVSANLLWFVEAK